MARVNPVDISVLDLAPAAADDLERLLQLQKRAFHGQALIYQDFSLPSITETLDDLKEEFRQKTIYKVAMGGKIIGSVRCSVKDATLFIGKLIVDPDLQNRGIGTHIMREIEKRYAATVRRIELSTGHKSARNLHLYRKLGYREIRQEPLNASCTLIVMEKDL